MTFEWQPILAAFINSVLVLGAVQVLKAVIPELKSKTPWLIPLVAGIVGPILATVQSFVGGWLGIPVDLSPIIGIFTGGSAVALHQIGKQLAKE